MPAPTAAPSSHRALTRWLQRNDWMLHSNASRAVDDIEALREGATAVNKTQFRAIVNTARLCDNSNTFKRFLQKRKDRRQKEGKKRKAAFWNELLNQLRIANDHARDAETAVADLSKSDKMRVVEVYFEHLIAHCQLRSAG